MPESDRYHGDTRDLMEIIRNLQKRVSALERTPNLGSSTIENGTLRVRDENGVVRVEMGRLEDGSYGFAVRESAQNVFQLVPLIYTSFVPLITSMGSSFTNLVWYDLEGGPSVQVNVGPSGRLLIIATVLFGIGGTPTNAAQDISTAMGIFLTGANTFTPLDPTPLNTAGFAETNIQGIVSSGTHTMAMNGSLTISNVFEGLNPGLTTVTCKYYRDAAASGNVVNLFNRALVVAKL